MGVYVTRVKRVEAIRFLEVTLGEGFTHSVVFDEQDNLPVWLRNALIDEIIFCTMDTENVSVGLFIDILGRSVEVHPGDWIVYTSADGFSVAKHEVFTSQFLPYEA